MLHAAALRAHETHQLSTAVAMRHAPWFVAFVALARAQGS
jgi:hypothetical protein